MSKKDNVGPVTPEQGVDKAPEGSEPVGAAGEPVEPSEDAGGGDDSFSRAYVEQLRTEAAESRVKAKRAEELEEALRAAVTAMATQGILADPTDLAWDDRFNGENGMPDQEAIRAAAEELASRKPHLGRVRGDVGAGVRGEEPMVSLSALLRSGA